VFSEPYAATILRVIVVKYRY